MAPNSERTPNMVPSLTAKSNAGNNNDVLLWADPATHALLVTGSISISGLSGNLTNNNAAPGATNMGVLPAIANVAAPTYGEGNQVLLSTDLSGALRVTGSLSVGGTTDGATFTASSSTGTPAMGAFHSVVDTVADGKMAIVGITASRAQFVSLYDAAGNALLGQKAMAASVPVVLASDQASIPVAATLNAETTKVIGKVRIIGNAGAIMDGVNTAATAPASGLLTLGIFNSTEPSPTTGQSVGIQLDSKGRVRNVIMDAAGNTRGANVDANNNLQVAQATAANFNATIVGTKTNNSAAPSTTNVGTLPALANAAIPTWSEGNQVSLSVDLSGNTRVVQPDLIVAATNITTQNLNLFTGAATANSTVASGTLNGVSTGTFQVTGNYTGNLVVQGTVDGATWVTLGSFASVGQQPLLTALASGATGIFQADISGFTKWRVTASNAITGTATVTLESTMGPGMLGFDTAVILDPSTAPSVSPGNFSVREAAVSNLTEKVLLEQLLVEMQGLNALFQGLLPNMRRVTDDAGREVVTLSNSNDKILVANLTLSASTSETTLIQGVAGVDNRLIAIVVSNTSASTATRVDIRDSTGGPVRFPLYSNGGANPTGFSLGGVAIPQTARGGNWTAQCSASTTDIRIMAVYSVN